MLTIPTKLKFNLPLEKLMETDTWLMILRMLQSYLDKRRYDSFYTDCEWYASETSEVRNTTQNTRVAASQF